MENRLPLYIVVPCYNEQDVLPETTKQLVGLLDRMQQTGQIEQGYLLYVDDGSKDTTWQLITQHHQGEPRVLGLKLAHNVGHQQALWAGLETAVEQAGAVISIDADLQDDIEVIPRMVDDFNQGKDVVFGVRNERTTDTRFKRWTALGFYKFMNALGSETVYNHADFRLLSQRALRALLSMPERNLFIRGMVSLLGFNTACEYYDRKARFAGESKYPFSKMMNFAMDGITSFSVKPLRWIQMIGLLFILVAICAVIYALKAYVDGRSVEGWTSLFISLWFVGGVLLIAIGITGEYIGKIYKEVKRRPLYFEQERLGC